MKIKIIDVSSPQQEKNYQYVDVTYRDIDKNTVGSRKIVSFATEVYKTITSLNKDDVAWVSLEKDKTGKYWNWVAVSATPPAEGVAENIPSKSTKSDSYAGRYESEDERRSRQISIQAQNALTNSVNLLRNEKSPPSVETVLEVATKFATWVQERVANDALLNLKDDIPQ